MNHSSSNYNISLNNNQFVFLLYSPPGAYDSKRDETGESESSGAGKGGRDGNWSSRVLVRRAARAGGQLYARVRRQAYHAATPLPRHQERPRDRSAPQGRYFDAGRRRA